MRRLSTYVAVAALLGLVLPVATTPATEVSASPQRAVYLVSFARGVNPDAEAAGMRRSGWNVRNVYRSVFPGVAVELPQNAATALARNPRVALIEPDAVVRTASSHSDTQTAPTWGLDRIDQRDRPLDGLFTYPRSAGQGVRMYIVDTGVRSTHSDLIGRTAPGATAIADGRGTEDCNGHGTHVAGTAAGSTYGVAKNATVVPVRVLDCSGAGTMSGVIAGVDWIAQTHPAGTPGVANLSLGGGASAALDTAVESLIARGVTVVVAAGNSNTDACRTSPARVPAALTVGATTRTDARASYSNFGPCLDLFAPGSDITSAWHTTNTATQTISGTSMAAPHVAGAAALLLGAEPSLTTAQVERRILDDASVNKVGNPGRRSPNRLLYVPAPLPEPLPEPITEPVPDPVEEPVSDTPDEPADEPVAEPAPVKGPPPGRGPARSR